MQSAGGYAQQAVSLADPARLQQVLSVNDPDDEAGQVHLACGVDTGHLRRFAADEGAAGLAATPGNAAHQRVDGLCVHVAECQT